MFIYLFWEREHEPGEGEREREGERESQAVSTELDEGLDLTNCEIMTWAEIENRVLNQLSHPGTPSECFLKFHRLPLAWMLHPFYYDLLVTQEITAHILHLSKSNIMLLLRISKPTYGWQNT